MNEGFVIPILVGRTELKIPVEVQLKTRPILRDHNPLVRSRLRVNDWAREHTVLGQRRQ